ncbi:MAG: carboxypeptidase-like regulatory domain-containing protein [Tannerellaceae bacterium]|nr:carboxypeptidase-like regulatory domain-containing protein [Tannerellaceae bacterium]MCD8265089.1 carboxypeptidase-like regulatory domain-containing protein [Tannerellaceae bacterium]
MPPTLTHTIIKLNELFHGKKIYFFGNRSTPTYQPITCTGNHLGNERTGYRRRDRGDRSTVQAIHTPSGTRYGTITNVDGRFSFQGMRTGGPYTVEISYIGYQTAVYTDITLQLEKRMYWMQPSTNRRKHWTR